MSIWDKDKGKFDPNLESDQLVFLQQRRYTDVRHGTRKFSREMVALDDETEDFPEVVRMNTLYESDDEDDNGNSAGAQQDTEQETDIDRPTLKLQPATSLTLPRSYTSNITYRQLKRNVCCGGARGVSWLGAMQGRIQASLNPGGWVPGVRSLHNFKEDWVLSDCDPKLGFDCTLSAFRGLSITRGVQHVVAKADTSNFDLELHIYTRAEWLDVIRISFNQVVRGHLVAPMGGCIATVVAYSTGLLPCSLPLAPLLNMALCWVPFSDGKENERRVSLLRLRVSQAVTLRRSHA
ncbi:hypothetical protein PTSG_08471 [Salpingoeca rosetta]|uniref:Uncharacterized protein n=1 Tax=Salpingoeca rosetta (strain ATCC 50818 / BSB-021) TaxID=946362 RepID=F2UJS6_SALR5|nr:uncharacterized protein PTSG_08471 [Salpingoeca rosetta]EGD77375.1 hypothetical protein PTSG_08471 [Salpingoeca rosetta]|eukprot:XP_004990719.1 hypothetical protein PTSG_08471 [Salpingoeca rosetta]